MSYQGLRDYSSLQTPPRTRKAVNVSIHYGYDYDNMIQQIMKEVYCNNNNNNNNRQRGQVFIVAPYIHLLPDIIANLTAAFDYYYQLQLQHTNNHHNIHFTHNITSSYIIDRPLRIVMGHGQLSHFETEIVPAFLRGEVSCILNNKYISYIIY
jgi:hypothetical protein